MSWVCRRLYHPGVSSTKKQSRCQQQQGQAQSPYRYLKQQTSEDVTRSVSASPSFRFLARHSLHRAVAVVAAGTVRFVVEGLRDMGTVLAVGFHYIHLHRSCRLNAFSLTAIVSRFGVLAGVHLHSHTVHLHLAVYRCLVAGSSASLLPALGGGLALLFQRGYNPFAAVLDWLLVLMSGEENLFPRQCTCKLPRSAHTAFFTSLSCSWREQSTEIALASAGWFGVHVGQNIFDPQSIHVVVPARLQWLRVCPKVSQSL